MAVYLFKDVTVDETITNQGSANQTVAGSNIITNRSGDESGDLVLKGKVERDGFPMPVLLANAIGTVTLTYDYDPTTPLQKVNPIRVERAEFSFDAKDKSNWDLTLICKRTGASTWSGWPNTQPSPAAPAAGTRYLRPGREKTADDQNISTRSVQVVDFWGIAADTDAGEVAQLAAIVAAYTRLPQYNQKVYNATLTRTDSRGGRVTIEWRTLNSADEIANPETHLEFDPYYIEGGFSSGTVIQFPYSSAFHDSFASASQLIALASGHYVVDQIETRKINDVVSNRIVSVKTTNSKLRQTMPRSLSFVDGHRLTDQTASAWVLSAVNRTAAFAQLPSATTSALVFRGLELQQVAATRFVATEKKGTRSTEQDVLFPRTVGVSDPCHIRDHFSSASLISSQSFIPYMGSAVNAMSTNTITMQRWTNGKFLSVASLAHDSTASAEQNRGTISRRSAVDAWTDVAVFVAPCLKADTAATLATFWFNFYKVNANLVTVTASKINNYVARIVLYYLNPGILVIGATRGFDRYVPARLSSGTPQVFVSQKIALDSTQFAYYVKSQRICAAMRQFTLMRTYLGGTIPDQYALIGQTNSDTFLGISPKNCVYDGAEYITNIGLSGTYVFRMYYHFREDINGIFNYEGIHDDWVISTASLSTGWNDSSLFTNNEINVAIPTTAAFTTVFLT